jgi:hypothetical protein
MEENVLQINDNDEIYPVITEWVRNVYKEMQSCREKRLYVFCNISNRHKDSVIDCGIDFIKDEHLLEFLKKFFNIEYAINMYGFYTLIRFV